MFNIKDAIIFTGGHHNSALLLACKFKQEGNKVVWFGHRHASQTDQAISREYQDVFKKDIPFFELKTGKIHRGNVWQLFKTLNSFFFCFFTFINKRPKLIISFGGYLAAPPVLAAWLLGIPTVSHEQTAVLGMANKTILKFVRKMYLTWPIDSLITNPKIKVVGLPNLHLINSKLTNSEVNKKLAQKYQQSFTNLDRPWITVCGGKQGSHFINQLISENLDKLLIKWNILHQTGANQKTKDYQKSNRKRNKLLPDQRGRYVVVDFMENFGEILQVSDLIIGRSGAHTVYEILKYGKKMIAIPLPFAYGDEQKANAQKLANADLGIILSQDKITPTNFLSKIEQMLLKTPDHTKLQLINRQIPNNSLEIMYQDIIDLLPNK